MLGKCNSKDLGYLFVQCCLLIPKGMFRSVIQYVLALVSPAAVNYLNDFYFGQGYPCI